MNQPNRKQRSRVEAAATAVVPLSQPESCRVWFRILSVNDSCGERSLRRRLVSLQRRKIEFQKLEKSFLVAKCPQAVRSPFAV